MQLLQKLKKYFAFAALVCFWHYHVSAQFGLRSTYGKVNFDEFGETIRDLYEDQNISILQHGPGIGIDYWFRLKKRRIEFMPTLYYNQYISNKMEALSFKGSSVDAAFNVHVYPMDLDEDCNCPTFSKDGNFIKKGFFVHVGPMVKYFMLNGSNLTETLKTSNLAFGLRAGAGLDIGINDLLTLSPMLVYERSSMIKWANFTSISRLPVEPFADISSNYGRLALELRLGLRFDERNKYRRR